MATDVMISVTLIGRNAKPKIASLNGHFDHNHALSAAGGEVVSMRNKSNRLEELFMRLVEGRDVGSGQAAAEPVGAPAAKVGA